MTSPIFMSKNQPARTPRGGTLPSRDWAEYDHFGDLLFPLFVRLVNGNDFSTPLDSKWHAGLNDLCALAEIKVAQDSDVRSVMLNDLRKAAENRIHVVAALAQRSRYYDTAHLAVRYVNITKSPEAKTWLRDMMEMYRRSTALIREINDAAASILLK